MTGAPKQGPARRRRAASRDELRLSLWCGNAEHPRVVVTPRDWREMAAVERGWRCARCGGVDVWSPPAPMQGRPR